MGKNRRRDRSQAGPESEAPSSSPFAGLEALRAQLPPGELAPQSAERRADSTTMSAKAVVRKQRSGHGGKTVTRIEHLDLPLPELEDLAARMKKALGCGARIDEGVLTLQGDLESRAAAWLESQAVARIVIRANQRS